MKKFDSVAVPSFLYGAMENYGLSIFRETLLLNFVNRTTETARYVVTNVICHELGHQCKVKYYSQNTLINLHQFNYVVLYHGNSFSRVWQLGIPNLVDSLMVI